MADFTIVKFDFKNYFNSISTIYVFEKYIKGNLSDRREIDLIKAFAYSTKYAYAGLCTSNTIAEIIATYFDEAIRQVFTENGLILYERYVDDCVLILNEHMEETEVNNTLNAILFDIFHDSQLSCNMCKTKFNIQKFCYISRRKVLADNHAISIDFLGYEFWLASRQQKNKVIITIQYGVTEAKRKKYSDRLDDLISYYAKRETDNADFNDLELLRHRIAAFSSREVYLSKHFRSNIWRVKGFISNYGELRFFLDTDLIEANTKSFLKNAIDDAFARANIKKPYFLLGGGYNLFDNMRTNKTILLVNHIGYDYNALSALCRQIGINSTDRNGKPRGYGNLVRDYLIKVRVGY